jgi:hypothetical protein
MLREQDIREDIGRAAHNGDFMRLVHIPTGTSRMHPGPLTGINRHQLRCRWLKEIESELVSRGLIEYIQPDLNLPEKSHHKSKR